MVVDTLPLIVHINTQTPGSIHDLFTIVRNGIPIIGWLLFATSFAIGGILVIAASSITSVLSTLAIDVSLYFFGVSFVLFLYALLPGLLISLMLYGGIAVILAMVGYAASKLIT